MLLINWLLNGSLAVKQKESAGLHGEEVQEAGGGPGTQSCCRCCMDPVGYPAAVPACWTVKRAAVHVGTLSCLSSWQVGGKLLHPAVLPA